MDFESPKIKICCSVVFILCLAMLAHLSLERPEEKADSVIPPAMEPHIALSLKENLNQRETGAEKDKDKFWALLRAIEGTDKYIVSVELAEDNDNELKIFVSEKWYYALYETRLQSAQNLWDLWAGIHLPFNSRRPCISIIDSNGKKIGGSRPLAGSVIWVLEDQL